MKMNILLKAAFKKAALITLLFPLVLLSNTPETEYFKIMEKDQIDLEEVNTFLCKYPYCAAFDLRMDTCSAIIRKWRQVWDYSKNYKGEIFNLLQPLQAQVKRFKQQSLEEKSKSLFNAIEEADISQLKMFLRFPVDLTSQTEVFENEILNPCEYAENLLHASELVKEFLYENNQDKEKHRGMEGLVARRRDVVKTLNAIKNYHAQEKNKASHNVNVKRKINGKDLAATKKIKAKTLPSLVSPTTIHQASTDASIKNLLN